MADQHNIWRLSRVTDTPCQFAVPLTVDQFFWTWRMQAVTDVKDRTASAAVRYSDYATGWIKGVRFQAEGTKFPSLYSVTVKGT
jgi:hypothetical protein